MSDMPSELTMPSAEERNWAVFAHLSALIGGVLFFCLGSIAGPLIIWLVKKDSLPFVDDQGKEALNFNITITIVFLALFLLSIVTFGIGVLIAIPVGMAVGVAWVVLTVIAAVKASKGVAYRYPYTLRLVS